MVNLEAVTLYHLTDEDEGIFSRTVLRGSVYKSEAVSAEKGGFLAENLFKIRIPGAEKLAVCLHDYVYIGEGPDAPVTADCKKICRISDNRRGALPHYRIEAV